MEYQAKVKNLRCGKKYIYLKCELLPEKKIHKMKKTREREREREREN